MEKWIDTSISIIKKLNSKGGSPIITLLSLVLLLGTAFFSSRAINSEFKTLGDNLSTRISAMEADSRDLPKLREQVNTNTRKVEELERLVDKIDGNIESIKLFLINK